MATDGENRIKVAIRVRSLSSKEKDKNKYIQWKLSENKLWQMDARTENKIGQVYTFDYVFGMTSLSQDIFEVLAKPIVESCVQGFNGTIFAYGQTSSGKTYTMMGEKDEEGIIPLSINHIFKTVENIPNREFLIRVAYMEIYNEQIHDLLEIKNNNLKIHEDSSGQAYVTLKEEITDTPEKVIAVMKKGEKMRRFGVTDINERSSRSHTIFRIVIESRKQQGSECSDEFAWDDAVQVSILNLVDLAGSERVMHTKATGDRFKEGCAINKSLFYLGNVISQLSDGSGQYVNFRDSKLTRILRTSLGGNAHTAIICTITPASVEETISTLSFASRAICVKNEPHVNEMLSDECLMRRHAALVKKLELELEKARQEIDCSSMKKELEQKEKIISRLKDWIQRDKVLAASPHMAYRSDRRKTWAASDLEFSLRKKQFPCGDGPLFSLPEEPKDNDFSMEVASPNIENIVFEDEEKIPGCSNVTLRRGSTGHWNKESNDNQSSRYSWHTLRPSSCDDQSKWSHEGSVKKRRVETEEGEEVAQCRKGLQEAILRLNGNSADLQSCTLMELVTQLASLAERDPMVKQFSDPSVEEKEKISTLEALLEKTKSELNSLFTEKSELESLLKVEQEKYFSADSQLKEALQKLENFSKQINSVPSVHVNVDDKMSSSLTEEIMQEGENRMETGDIEIKEALDKISFLMEENKKLENEILAKDNKSILLKFREKLLNLEEKLEKSEAEFVSICIGNDSILNHTSKEQIPQNVEDHLNDNSHSNGYTEETCLENDEKAESLEEELDSKIDIFERLYNLAKGYSVQLKEEIEKAESLETELKEMQQKISFDENRSNCEGTLQRSEASLDASGFLEKLGSERNLAETVLTEEQKQLQQVQIIEDLSKLNNLSQDLEDTVAQSQKEIERINLQLEQERLKALAFEVSLEEKNREIEKLMLREKELCSVVDGHNVKAENEVKNLLSQIESINSEKSEAEEREYKLKCEMTKCKEVLTELETQLQESKNQIVSLSSRNEEFESLLNLEKQSSQEMKCQLHEVLEKNNALSKELADILAKSSCNEDELVERLNEETDKVIRIGNELQSKMVEVENLNAVIDGYKLQIDGERNDFKLVEKELKEALAKTFALNKEQSSLKLLEWAEEMFALKGKLDCCLINLSNLKTEQNCSENLLSEENSSHNFDTQLQSSLAILETVSGQMGEFSKKLKSEEIEFSSSLKNDVQNSEMEEIPDEMTRKNSMMMAEFKTALTNSPVCNNNKTSLISELNDQEIVDENITVKLKEKIARLEVELEKSKTDLCSITSEKDNFEMILASEKEQLQNAKNELQRALDLVDDLTQRLNEATAKCKTDEETMSARFGEEMERVKQLEDELEASEVVIANLAISEDEVMMEFKELIRHREILEKELMEAQEKISGLCEENHRAKDELNAREDERSATALEYAEKISRLEASIEEYKSQLCKISCDESKIDTNKEIEMSALIMEQKAKISELEDILQVKESDISRYGNEKGEMETLLITEKEKYQNVSTQLAEAIANLDNVTKELYESSSNHREAEVQLASLLNMETEKVRKLEDDLESKKQDLEKVCSRAEELSALLNEERCRKAELEVELQKVMSNMPNPISNEGVLNDSSNDTEANEKISLYEKKIADLEERNASDIARLGYEKGELESLLISEKEKHQVLSSHLSEALANLSSVSKELGDLSAKQKEAEQLQILLNEEVERMRKLEDELKTKEDDLEKLNVKVEELDILLNEERCRKAELEVELQKVMTDSKEDTLADGDSFSVTEVFGKIPVYEQKIAELEEALNGNVSEISKLGFEKKELEIMLASEKDKYQKIFVQLTDALVILDNVTKALDETSAKQREAEELSLLLNEEIQKVVKLEDNLKTKEDDLEKITIKAEELSTLLKEERCRQVELIAELQTATFNSNEAVEKISLCEQNIRDLEGIVDSNTSEISKLGFEKKELELMLASEKDKYYKIFVQLTDALVILDNVTKALDETSAKQREADELSHLLEMEREKVKNLEEDMETKEVNLEKLTIRTEELSTLLKEERFRKAELEEELNKALPSVTNSNLNESAEMNGDSINAESLEKISGYEQKIVELEEVLERNATENSRLGLEKGELESLLISEKENYQILCSQLNEALANLNNVTTSLEESSSKQREAEELHTLLNEEIQKVRILEDELKTKEEDLEKLNNRVEELGILLNEERCRKTELEVELENAMLAMSKSKSDEAEVMEDGSSNVTEALEKISGYEQKIAELEGVLERNALENSKHGLEKGELESLLISEKEKYQILSSQLNEALANLEDFRKSIDETCSKQREAEVVLNEEIQKVRKLEDDLKTKEEDLEKLNNRVEELEMLLNEERCRKTELEVELENAMLAMSKSKPDEAEVMEDGSGNVTETLEKISGYEQKISELEEVLERNTLENSKLGLEKGELESLLISEKEKYQILCSQLNEALANLDNVTKSMDESSSKQREAEEMLNEEIQKVRKLEDDLKGKEGDLEKLNNRVEELGIILHEERCRKTELEVELENVTLAMSNSKSNEAEALEKISGYDHKMVELEGVLERITTDNSRLGLEKGELESLLISEKEKYQILSSQFNEALANLDNVTKSLDESSSKQREAEEMLNEEIQKVRKLEDDLKGKEGDLEKLNNRVEELGIILHEERCRKTELEVELENVTLAMSNSKSNEAEALEKISGYEHKMVELEGVLERIATDNSRLGLEKGELESLLISEKENYQILCSQLNEALANLDNITKSLDESSSKQREAEELHTLLNEEIQKVRKLEDELKTKEGDLEKLNTRVEELEILLNEERCRKTELEVELENVTLAMSNSKSNEAEALEKISQYEHKIVELEEVSESNATEISRLGLEKGELESLLISEKESYQKLSSQLTEALLTIDNLTKELNESSVRYRDAEEQLISLLNAESLKVTKLEEEVEVKIEDFAKLNAKADEYLSQLHEQKSISENKDLEIQELILKVNSNEEALKKLSSAEIESAASISKQAARISELEALIEECDKEIGSLSAKNVELESSLNSERELSQSLALQLEDAIRKAESLSTEIRNISCNFKVKEEELQSNVLSSEKLAMEAEEHGLRLKEEREKSASLETKMCQLLEDIHHLKEEKLLLIEHGKKEEEAFSAHAEEIQVLKTLLEERKSELSSVILERNDLVANLASKKDQFAGVQSQLTNALIDIDTLSKKLIEVSNQYESSKGNESEVLLSARAELDKAQYALSVCAKSEEDLDHLLCIEKNKVSDLRKQLSEESAKKEDLISKNMELTNSMQTVEQQLTLLIEDHGKCIENETKLIATNEELSAEVEGLQAKLNASKLGIENLETVLVAKKDEISLMEKRNAELSLLLESSDKRIIELEIYVKEVKEEIFSKVNEVDNGSIRISQLQSSLEEAQSKIEAMSTELQLVKNSKEDEDSLKTELSHLEAALQEANNEIKNVREVKEMELENERNSNKKTISRLEDQIGTLREELKNVLESNEGKISSLEKLLKVETEKCVVKAEEVTSLLYNRNELAELLKAEKGRVSNLEKQILKEEEKSNILVDNLERAKSEIEEQVKKNDRLKALENDLRSKLELEKKMNAITENELAKVKSALSSSESSLNQLRSELNSLEKRCQEEVSMVAQLKTQLELEKEARLAAREAEERLLGVLAAQEKAFSVLKSTKEGTSTEVKTQNEIIQEKEKQLKELAERLEDQENYSKQMDQVIEKMERRYNVLLDHRLEVQNKAKEKEETLMNEIAKLQKRIDELSKSGLEKPNVNELEKQLKSERLRKEEAERKLQAALLEVKNCNLQVEDYKKEVLSCKQLIQEGANVNELEKELKSERLRKEEADSKLKAALLEVSNCNSKVEVYKKEILRCKQLLCGGVTRQEAANRKQAKLVECGVQTTPVALPEIQEIRPDGSGVVQYYKIDLLEQKVKKLEEDKEFLKKLCRRRHDQREELKLKLEALTGKVQTVKEPENKENMSVNIKKP